MKALFYAAAGAAILIAGAAEAHQAGARYNAAAGYARGPVIQTRAPVRTKAVAMPTPYPREPPVTMTVVEERSLIGEE